MGASPDAPASTPRWISLAFIITFALVAYLLYASHEHRQALRAGLASASKQARLLTDSAGP